MARFLLISAILVGMIAGCGRNYGGGSSVSYGNADHQTTTEVVMQRDPNGRLLFIIAWIAKHGGGGTQYSRRNLLTSIHGREVHPHLDRRAVYALQVDGSLRQVALSDEKIAALFREIAQTGFHTSHSELWQKAVAPSLISVEAPIAD